MYQTPVHKANIMSMTWSFLPEVLLYVRGAMTAPSICPPYMAIRITNLFSSFILLCKKESGCQPLRLFARAAHELHNV